MSVYESLQEARQRFNLTLQQSGEEIQIAGSGDLPWSFSQLSHITGQSPEVCRTFDSGLTAVVYQLKDRQGQSFALKLARTPCLVQNVDGQTSFLNEVLCRRHLAQQRREHPGTLAAVTSTMCASLRHGVILSEWIDGAPVQDWTRRQLEQVFAAGSELLLAGLFEWDYSPGNILDDGRRIRLFDFGYAYPFDPLRHFNSAGNGSDTPMFHLAERFETRAYFGHLLRVEKSRGPDAALAAYRLEKEVAAEAYVRLAAELRARGASDAVLAWTEGWIAEWLGAMNTDLLPLYLKEGWRSHMLDLDDDLRGKTCTPMTIERCQWLLDALRGYYPALRAAQAFFGDEADLSQAQLLARYEAHLAEARHYQIGWQQRL